MLALTQHHTQRAARVDRESQEDRKHRTAEREDRVNGKGRGGQGEQRGHRQ
jgi:hypothetical protein